MAGLHFDITGDNSNLMDKLRQTENGIRQTSRSIEQSGMGIEKMFSRITTAAAGLGAAFSAQQFASQVMRVRGEFQQLEVAFETMLGSAEKANDLMSQLTHTAAITPFGLQDVAGGAKHLLAYGVAAENVNDTLIRLGDIAAGLSIPLNDLVYLYGTTMTQERMSTQDLRQFQGRGIPLADELAKQFGVTKDKVGELVTAGKVGFEEMHKAIVSMTSDGGKFGGLMEAQSKTITGQISNIQDAIDGMFNEIGKSSEGVINLALGGVSTLVENWEKVAEAIGYAVTAYGSYKAVVMAMAAMDNIKMNVAVSQEIEGYRALLDVKEQNKNADLEAAVASGSLTQAKASEIAAVREEIRERLALLQAKKAEAAQEEATALQQFELAKQEKDAADEKLENMFALMEAAEEQGDASYMAYAQEQLQTASANANTAATRLNTAERNLNTASSRAKATAESADTFTTNVNTVANNANTTSMNFMKAAALQLQTVLKGLWGTLMANPLAIVVGGLSLLAYTVYKVATAETAAEKAARKHREEQEKQLELYKEKQNKIQSLLNIIRDETETEYEKIRAYEELCQLSPLLVSAYSREELATINLKDATKLLNEERDKSHYNELQREVAAYTAKLKTLKLQLEKMGKDGSAATNQAGFFVLSRSIEDTETYLRELQNELNKIDNLKKQAAEQAKPVEVKLVEAKANREQILQEFNAAKLALEQAQENLKKSPFATIPFSIQLRFDNAQKDLKQADTTIATLEEASKTTDNTYKTAYNNAEADWKAKKKALEDAKKKNVADYEKAKTEYEDAKKVFEGLGGDTTGKAKKEDDKEKEAAQRRADELLAIRRENQQTEINLMKEGSEKRLAQINLDYQRELDAIKKQEEEWKKAQNGKLTDEQQQTLVEWDARATEKADAGIDKVYEDKMKAERKAQQQLLIQFGNYQQQRQGIEQKYADLKDETNVEGEKKLLDAQMQAELQSLDEKFGYTTTAMADLFEDASQKSVNAIQSIIDKYEALVAFKSGTEQEDGTKVTKEDLLGLGISEKDIEALEKGEISIKDLTDRIKELKGELKESSPWELFTSDLNNAIKKIKTANGDTTKIGEGISGVGNAVSSFAPALKEFSSNIGNIFGFDDSKIQGAIDGLDGLGQTAAGVGQIMSGDIVGGAMAAVGGISKVVTAFEGMFGADYSSYNKLVEEYGGLIDVWDKLIDRKLEYIDIDYGDEARKAGEEAIKIINKEINAYRTLGKERLNAGASVGSHSIGMRIKKNMSDEGWDEFYNAAKEMNIDGDRLTSGRMEGLFNLSAKQLEDLQAKAPTFWAKLDEDVRDYLEKIIESNEQLEETKNKLKEATTGISFDSFYDSFTSTLMDMESSSKDFADNFEEYMKQSILSSLIANKYRDKIQSLYDDWAKKSDTDGDGLFDLTAAESKELKEAQKALAEQMIAERDAMADTFGWDDTYSQEASSKGFQTMSQDTGDELNGRFTALQISNEEIKNQIIQTVTLMNQMVVVSSQGNVVLNDILQQQALANIHLANIVKYTKATSALGDKLDSIIENTKNL